MIRAHAHELISVRVRILAIHALVVCAGNQVPEMAGDRVRKKRIARFIPIHAPRIRPAIRHDLESFPRRMIAPNSHVHLRALRGGCAGSADIGRGENAVATVEPAVRPPAQTVYDVVPDRAVVPAIEHYFRRTIGKVVTIFVRDKEQIRRSRDPHAAEADFHGSQTLALIPKNRAFVETTVVVRVVENHDPIALLRVEVHLRLRISVTLHHPQTSARIRGDRDRLLHIRLGGKHGDVKSRRHANAGGCLIRRHWPAGRRLRVERNGEVRGKSGAREGEGEEETHEMGKS